MTIRQSIVLAIALLISTSSLGHHPTPMPPPVPIPTPPVSTPALISAPWWLFPMMAAPIIGFAIQHYMATKDEKK